MISAFVTVWQSLATYIAGLFETVGELFYSGESLTFVGTMAVVMAGVALMLLVFNLVRSFFAFRG